MGIVEFFSDMMSVREAHAEAPAEDAGKEDGGDDEKADEEDGAEDKGEGEDAAEGGEEEEAEEEEEEEDEPVDPKPLLEAGMFTSCHVSGFDILPVHHTSSHLFSHTSIRVLPVL